MNYTKNNRFYLKLVEAKSNITSWNKKLLLLNNKKLSSEQQNDKMYNYGTYNKCLSSGHLSSGLGTGVEVGHQSNESLAYVVQNPGIVVISVT